MAQRQSHTKRKTYKNTSTSYQKPSRYRQKPVKKTYIVTPQTAYHVQELALQEDTTEGRIIDKIMRTYLSNLATEYEHSHQKDAPNHF